jgi:hypothetical protein
VAEISGLSVHSGGIDSLERWALAQFSAQVRQKRQSETARVQDELSQLLFGVDLDPGQLKEYRARLLDAIARVDGLEQDRILRLGGELSVPRSKMMMTVGGMGWLPSKTTLKSIEVTPAQEIHSRNLAKTLQTVLAQNPKSVPRDFHTVGIVVARGAEGERWGQDKVQLSQWGLDIVHAKDYPSVARLRLPPRFPTQAEMVQFRAS